MQEERNISSLEQLLERIADAARGQRRISLGEIVDQVGRRSFGPLLLVAGLVTLAPIVGDIPGVPTLMCVLVLLVAGQLLFRREHFWLPAWLLDRSVKQDKLHKALDWLQKPAQFVDRLLKPRLMFFTRPVGIYLIALVCILIAAGMPAMELVPFSANGAGIALTLFGLALIADDGLLALIALALTVTTFASVAYGIA